MITNTLWYILYDEHGWLSELEQASGLHGDGSIRVVYYNIGGVSWFFVFFDHLLLDVYVVLYHNNESFCLIWDIVGGLFELEQGGLDGV